MGSGEIVLVTGGAGFIGSHVVDALLETGRRVIVLDDFSTGKRANLVAHEGNERLIVVRARVEEGIWSSLATVARRWAPPDRIVHLAAQTSVIASLQTPLCDVQVNLMGTLSVLEYARHHDVKKLVLASSAAVYGDTETVPTPEAVPLRPQSPYGINKLASEHYLACYHDVHGVRTVALRFFNVFGPRQDPSSPYSGVISIFTDRAMAGLPMVVFGDGKQTRDFVYVDDVARGVVTACLEPGGEGQVMNIGTGHTTSLNELVVLVKRAAGSNSPVTHAEPRAGEIRHSQAVADRARDVLGFEARTSVADGLAALVHWLRPSGSP